MNTYLRRSIQQFILGGASSAFALGVIAAVGQQNPPPAPGQTPDYFGVVPNYANSPQPILATVTISDATGTGAVAAATTYDYVNFLQTPGITSIQLVNGGSGYSATPTVTITGGPGSAGATATAVVANGVITGITVTSPGTGYVLPIAGSGIRKFVDSLPLPNTPNNLGQQLPVAVPDTTSFPGADYYEIAETEYSERLHSDLPPTHLRGYKQLNAPAGHAAGINHYLGPIIIAQKDRAVRIKLVNQLSTGVAGKLGFPVDTTYMGTTDTVNDTDNRTALHLHGGNTPWISDGTPRQTVKPAGEVGVNKGESARDVPDMWFDATGKLIASCAEQLTCAVTGATNNPGDGSLTYYFTNQQSARLMFYHDHAEGITRLNVYGGLASAYLLQDPTETAMTNGGTVNYGTTAAPQNVAYPAVLPIDVIPLVIQEKTFMPDNTTPVLNNYGPFASQLNSQDPSWRWGSGTAATGLNGNGDLWVPHVFMPNQNPGTATGANAMGRWDYGPWFWPPFTGIQHGPIPNPYYDPACVTTTSYCEPSTIPGVPNGSVMNPNDATGSPSGTPEAINDTPLVNGTAYPFINVDPKKYRLRLLSVGNDRMFNLSLVVAASKNTVTTATENAGAIGVATLCDGTTAVSANPAECTEVKMVPFNAAQNAATPFPAWWYSMQKGGVTFDGRPSGVFDPRTRGPEMVQVATEGGFLSAPVEIKNQPVNYEYNPKNILIGNIKEHALLLGPAERADVVVDFSQFAGSTLIMYNDAPAPVPAWDLRLDYYTGDYDNTDTGGAFSTIPGYGPNSRTIMQIRVAATCTTANCATGINRTPGNTHPVDDVDSVHLATLNTAVQTAFRTSQEPIIVPQAAYNGVYGVNVADVPGADLSRIHDNVLTYTPLRSDALAASGYSVSTNPLDAITLEMKPKTIIEDWTMNWGRMNALLGTEVPHTTAINQTSIPQAYIDPPTELVKITSGNATPISGTAPDGTQLWKITHNGVDSHAVHFHLFHVQLVNRIGWDGAIYPPEGNELGWKDTVLMHPLSSVVVALRPKAMTLPFKMPNSRRILDPSHVSDTNPTEFFNFNPLTGNASNVANANSSTNFGWEYVWHCHILGHEENDMMRSIAVAQPPEAPIALSAVDTGNVITVSWTDNSVISNWVTIQRALDSGFTTGVASFDVLEPECAIQAGCPRSYIDSSAPVNTTVYYRILANNTVGAGVGRADQPLNVDGSYSVNLPAALASLTPQFTGYANVTAESVWSNTIVRSAVFVPTLVPTVPPTPVPTLVPTLVPTPVPPIPVAVPQVPNVVVDNFNRANARTLGPNWLQVGNIMNVNNNQATANGGPGLAYLISPVLGANQAAGFTYAGNTIRNNSSLFLKASGAKNLQTGQLQNAIRVRYSRGSVSIATTINGNAASPTYTNVGAAISTGGTLANGNSLLAAVDSSGVVWVWKKVGTTTTLLTPLGVQLPADPLWTTGTGQVGLSLPDGARVDNFAAY